MILKASTRGSAVALGRHLTNAQDNEHIEQHEVRGFVSDNVMDALREHDAVAKGVKSRQTLFSVSLSPPQHEQVDISVFESAIDEIEQRNGLADQPRIVVFHEKEGRRHAHAVWSRIDAERMVAIPLPFYKQKLQELSREIYLEQQWDLPKGLIDKRERDPRNFDLAMYQQAKREGIDPKQLKLLAQEAWSLSDSREAFAQALEERGLYLAQGDKRSYTAMTWRGEVHSVPKLLDRKTKEVRERIGDPQTLRSLDDARAYVAEHIAPKLQTLVGEAERQRDENLKPLNDRRVAMKAAHEEERRRLDAAQAERQQQEQRDRAERMRSGIGGFLDRITGRYSQIQQQNEREAWEALQRDREQRQQLVDAQLAERRELQTSILDLRNQHNDRVTDLHRDLAQQLEADRSQQKSERQTWLDQQQRQVQEERQAWADAQQQAKAQERERWLAQQQSHVRQIEPEPQIDRVQWLRDQQRPATPQVEPAPAITPQFNQQVQRQPEPTPEPPKPAPEPPQPTVPPPRPQRDIGMEP